MCICHASKKKSHWCDCEWFCHFLSWKIKTFDRNTDLFVCFVVVEIKLDRRYQIGRGYRLLSSKTPLVLFKYEYKYAAMFVQVGICTVPCMHSSFNTCFSKFSFKLLKKGWSWIINLFLDVWCVLSLYVFTHCLYFDSPIAQITKMYSDTTHWKTSFIT